MTRISYGFGRFEKFVVATLVWTMGRTVVAGGRDRAASPEAATRAVGVVRRARGQPATRTRRRAAYTKLYLYQFGRRCPFTQGRPRAWPVDGGHRASAFHAVAHETLTLGDRRLPARREVDP